MNLLSGRTTAPLYGSVTQLRCQFYGSVTQLRYMHCKKEYSFFFSLSFYVFGFKNIKLSYKSMV